jgi:iron complex transport system substrate-binding protein
LEPGRLIACTYFARDPGISGCAEQAAKVQNIVSGDVEEIIRLQPDLVIVAGFTPTSNVALLRGAGLNVFRFGRYDTLADVRANIDRLGYMVGAEEAAQRLVERTNQALRDVQAKVEGQPQPKVLYYTPDGYTAGLETVFDDLLEYAGGRNAAAEAGVRGYEKISTEIAISLNPDVLVFSGVFQSADGEMQDPMDFVRGHDAWTHTPAVRDRRVYVLPAKSITNISHHVVEGAEQLARLLHPQCFDHGAQP